MNDPKYGSHLPVLLRLVDETRGSVLELGMGLWSTPMLDLMCKQDSRTLVSFDNDSKWFDDNKKWESEYHKVHFVDDWDKIDIGNTQWSIALMDHRPALRRHVDALRLKDNADFIVIHDSEKEGDRFYRYSSIYKFFKYKYEYTKCLPNTTVLSNFIDLSFLGS